MKKALVCLAEGFEETEAIIPIDVLRRAEMDVVVAGVPTKNIKGAHGIEIVCDTEIENCEEYYDVIVIPGGMPGAVNLSKSFDVIRRIINTAQSGIVASICASPAVVLGNTGLIDDKEVVCYPGMEAACPKIKFADKRCVVSSNVITAQGPGVALEFALTIVEEVLGKEKRDLIAKDFLA